MISTSHELRDLLKSDQYAGYAYSYPHKLAYRKLSPPVELKSVWKDEPKDQLFLYVHIPFCEMRCGFCNLFTTVQPAAQLVQHTLQSIKNQSQTVSQLVTPKNISHLAIGGGTPSFLTNGQLENLLNGLKKDWSLNYHQIDSSVETSPATVSAEKLLLLKNHNIKRVSMGIQSFQKESLQGIGRPQKIDQSLRAIELVKSFEFPTFNLDLIYGGDQQTLQSWEQTLNQAIQLEPEEIYLYPLYVRHLTGLGKTGKTASQLRREQYLVARQILEQNGYNQLSMRHFRKKALDPPLDFQCQRNGMIGLGPGARSYTSNLHYSSEYAVGQKGVKEIIHGFNGRTSDQYAQADFGFRLNSEEQKRRFVIKSLLKKEGISKSNYLQTFSTELQTDFPCLQSLKELQFAIETENTLQLNELGLSWSDVIGPWLYSPEVAAMISEQMEVTQ